MRCKASSVGLGDRWLVFITFLLQPVGLLMFLRLCQRNNLWKRSYVEDVFEELSMDEPCFKPDAQLPGEPNTKRGLLPPNSDLSDLSFIGGLELSSR